MADRRQTPQRLTNEEHDLLIRIDENLRNLTSEVKDIKDGVKASIADHETRLRRLEETDSRNTGAFNIIQIGWGLAVTIVSIIISYLLRRL